MKSITINTSEDSQVEPIEELLVTLNGITGGLVTINDSFGIVSITDNDKASVSINDVSSNEDEGTITLSAILDNAVKGGFDVDINTSDSSATTADNDYTAISNETLTFTGNAGEIKTFTVTPTSDTKLEGDEALSVSMDNLSGTTLPVNISDSATVTILNDDDAALTINDANASEGSDISFTLELTEDVQGDVAVDVSFANETTKPGDFIATTQSFIFVDGKKGTKIFTVPTTNDSRLEDDETFAANVDVTYGNAAIDATDSGRGTIVDDDNAEIIISNASAEEGENLNFILELTNDVEDDVEVTIYFENTTTNNSDYSTASQNLTFFEGLKGTKTITLGTVEDKILEPNESFVAKMRLVSGNSEIVLTDTGIGTIFNDDAAAVSIADVSGYEDDGAITLSATLNYEV